MSLNDLTPTWSEEDHTKFMKETQYLKDELDSEDIDHRMPYSKQAEVVKNCLKEAFGDDSIKIKIVNRFFFSLKDFMDDLNGFQSFNGNKNSPEYSKLVDRLRMSGNDVKGSLIDYGKNTDDKLKDNLSTQGKEQDEIDKIIKARYDRFLVLLREKIKFESK
ncbi:MAG: hypothetical protein PHS92_03920 [Candidatus Gracilibacteria bacterium]|nr:hypothetical protein [Candidatus Gracilibacteria bacterium]